MSAEKDNALARFVEENLIPALGAIVLALMIRSFAVQPFTIPTGSMEPTLHGDYVHGDKILADKAAYALGEPKRLDVVVFKFPEDKGRKRDFIKRMVGLPGETFEIEGGEAYINGKMLRKPLERQEGIWMLVEKVNVPKDKFSDSWAASEDLQIGSNGLVMDGREGSVSLAYRDTITDASQRRGYGENLVGDLMVRLKAAVLSENKGAVRIRLRDMQGSRMPSLFGYMRGTSVAQLELGDEAATFSVFRDDKQLGSFRMAPWKPQEYHTIEFSSYDGTANLLVDGEAAVQAAYEKPASQGALVPRPLPQAGVDSEGVLLAVRSIGIYRDVYWTNMDPWGSRGEILTIPERNYVVLGDNSPRSEDSRGWDSSPYVPRDNLVGRATAIFWPPWRWRLIR